MVTPSSASYFTPPAPAQSSGGGGGGGFSIFGWHPSIPNLGGTTAVKQLVSGFAEIPSIVADAGTGDWSGMANLGKGLASGLFGAAATAGNFVGVPFTDYTLATPIEAAGEALTGIKPQTGFEIARKQGIIPGIVNTVAPVVAVAAPIAGALGRAASAAGATAAEAASTAAEAAAAGSADAGALGEAATTAAARAAQIAQRADLAHAFAHPYTYVGGKLADVSVAARDVLATREIGASTVEQPSPLPHEVVQNMADAVRANQNPVTAAASNTTRTAAGDMGASLFREAGISQPEAQGAAATAIQANEALMAPYAGAETRTFYRGEPPAIPGEAGTPHATRGQLFTENPQYAEKFATEQGQRGNVYKVEVPVDEHGNPLVGEAAPKPDTGHVMPADWADAAQPVEPRVPKAPKVAGGPLTEAQQAQVDAQVAEAQGAVRQSSVEAQVAKRLSVPPPNWAIRLAEALPDSANRVLSYMASPVDRFRLHAVARDMGRLVEVSQRAARSSEAVKVSSQAARDILDSVPELARQDVSRMIGEELNARLNGTALVDALINQTAGNAHPDLIEAMRNVARDNHPGIPQEVLDRLSPEARTALNDHLNEATAAWREQAKTVRDTMLGSRKGAQGLERALLEDVSPTMTPGQVKMFRRAINDLRRAEVLRERIPEMESARQAAADRAGLFAAKASRGAEAARRLVGIALRTADSLHEGVPKGVQNLDTTVAEIMDGVAQRQGITYDVGMGHEAAAQTTGYAVGIALQFDVPLEDFLARGQDLVKEAVANPHDIDGNAYGWGLWAGQDAKLGLWQHTASDGTQWVAGDISLGSWRGAPLEQWQATILGEAFHQESTWDFNNNTEVKMTQQPDVQNLSAHYADMALDPRSQLSRFGRQLTKNAAGAERIDPAAIDAQMRLYMTWDYAMSRANPEGWKLGDFFKKVNVDFGKNAPVNASALTQTVLNLTTGQGVEQSFATLDARTVSDALAWYYDSHDYIDSMYKDKTITLLDGSQRPADQVFYDLLAVTSVMASPKQNLGRALMGFANMEDFLNARKGAALTAQALMDKLEKVQPGVGKEYANAFEQLPEVRALTHQTSMVTTPKYNVLDILRGKLRLDTATTEDISRLPEHWTGKGKALSSENLPRSNVARTMQTLGINTPEAQAYTAWAAAHDELTAYRTTIDALRSENKAAGVKTVAADVLHDSPYSTFAELDRAWKASAAQEKALLADAGVARAHDQALMEYHGSNALAKLRSFRSNLSDPHNSLAVTLDTVIGKMYGFRNTDWAGGDTYGTKANEIRQAAQELTQTLGRDVKPHEVQAMLWVYTKMEIGRQDWGRLLAHHDIAQNAIDAYEQRALAGQPVNPAGFDPLKDYYDEELGYSRARTEQMLRLKELRAAKKAGPLSPVQADELARLERPAPVRTAPVQVAPEAGAPPVTETRYEIPYDAKTLTMKENQYKNYLSARQDVQDALAVGDYQAARQRLQTYVTRLRRSVYGDAGGSFQTVGEETRAKPSDSAAIAEARLQDAKNVPAPRSWMSNYISPLAARYNREVGLPAPTPIDTLSGVLPERTAAVSAEVQRLADREAAGHLTPAEQAASAASYRALQTALDSQYQYMTDRLGMQVNYVSPDQEYGIGTLGDAPQDYNATGAHSEMVRDIRGNNRIKVRGTALAGDGPNHFMSEISPVTGIMYNDMLRAVHDFFGHAQAANDFSRQGENIAQMLHLQMVPEAAKAALITEFRAQTAYLVDQGAFLDKQLTALLPDEMRQPDYMIRGDTTELHQRGQGTIRGAAITAPGADGRMTMRLFQDAAIDTLAHEGGHLLRQMLPQEHLDALARYYPHILDTAMSDVRRASEEAFVNDLMHYIRASVKGGEVPGHLADTFSKIAATLEEAHAQWLDSVTGKAVPADIHDFWSRMFSPQIERPDAYTDPLSTQRVTPGGVETKQFRWETPAEYAQRTRQYGEARQSVETARLRAQQAAQRAQKADTAARQMTALLHEPTRAQILADAHTGRAAQTLERLATQMEDPSTARVPAQWQPLWDAFKGLREDAKLDESGQVADALGEVPDTFSKVLQWAAERGFEPTYTQSITWEQAQRYLFDHIRLGQRELTSTMRKTRTGALSRAGLADQSLEQLSAGLVYATKEVYTNELIGHIERYYARPIEPGTAIPSGWVPWDSERAYILSGTRPSGDVIAPGATAIVPKAVQDALNVMSRRYDHWTFHVVSRATSPWRTVILTMSPKWYVNNFIGNVVLASAEGVRFGDWVKAVKDWKRGDQPLDIVGHAYVTADEMGNTLLQRPVRETLRAEGTRAAIAEVKHRMIRLNEGWDEIARSAVYDKTLRTTGSREAALTRAYQALVDYGDMSPFERAAIRSIIPFYTWQKGMLKLLARFPSDHPMATPVLLRLGQMHNETLQDQLGGSIPDAYTGLTKFGNTFINTRAMNPFQDAAQLATPQGIAASINPYIDLFLRDAYQAPAYGTAQPAMGPTGALMQDVNVASALGQHVAGFPQVRLAGQLAAGGDVYGQNPGVATAVGRFLGEPRTYTPADLATIANRVRKSQKAIAKAG